MIQNVSYTDEFISEFKRLSKKYRSLQKDFLELQASLCENPLQGNALTMQLRKVRMGITSKGERDAGRRARDYPIFGSGRDIAVYLYL